MLAAEVEQLSRVHAALPEDAATRFGEYVWLLLLSLRCLLPSSILSCAF